MSIRFLTDTVRFPGSANTDERRRALLELLRQRFPGDDVQLQGGPPDEALLTALESCLGSSPAGDRSICGLSLAELRRLLALSNRKRATQEEKRERAQLLTRLRNVSFGF